MLGALDNQYAESGAEALNAGVVKMNVDTDT